MSEILNRILNVTNKELDWLNVNFVKPYLFHHNLFNHDIAGYFDRGSGEEHYRLLMFISTLYNNEILFDVGTNRCASATALSFNENNIVKSYDIKQILPGNPVIDNVRFIIGDATEDEDLIKSPFVFLDVDHDGIYENILYNHLHKINWKGLLMFDDIHLNKEMKEFWNNITEEKYDISNLAHWSGTGICLFK